MSNYWIGVVSKNHVAKGVAGGFMQVCHGKQAPLRRIKPGDWLIYYSPKIELGKKELCQKFTAIGKIQDDNIYQYDMGGGFVPYRRDVKYVQCKEAAIQDFLQDLSFIKNKKNWGYVFRFGLVKIPKKDFLLITQHMGIKKDKYD